MSAPGDKVGNGDAFLGLNAAQLEAVTHRGGPLLVVAGPGTGKTRVLTCRLVHLLESGAAGPEQILAITFTNHAACEIRQRVGQGLPGHQAVQVATFHRWALHYLKRAYGPRARLCIDEEDARLLCREAGDLAGMARGRGRDLYPRISHAKQRWPVTFEEDPDLLPLFERYQALLAQHGLWDYDDLLLEALDVLQQPDDRLAFRTRVPFVLVDEFQDVSPVQYALVCSMAAPEAEIMVIGDPDQAIYGFRGASPGFVRRFMTDFKDARLLHLATAYRSPQVFLDAASSVVRTDRPALRSVRRADVRLKVRPFPDARAEARWVARRIETEVGGLSYDALDRGIAGGQGLRSLADVAVLYRINALAEGISEALAAAGIPFQRADEPHPLSIPEVRAVWRLWEAVHGRQTAYHLTRLPGGTALWEGRLAGIRQAISGLPPGGVVRGLIGALGLDAGHPLLRALCRAAAGWTDTDTPGLSLRHGADLLDTRVEAVSLLSIHASKGLEFSVVFIVGCEEGVLPWPGGDIEEEGRLFYVGLTRASERLYLSHAKSRRCFGRLLPGNPSPFLKRIPDELLDEERPAGPRRPKRPRQRTLF